MSLRASYTLAGASNSLAGRNLVSTLKCNTQVIASTEVVRSAKTSICNVQEHLGKETGLTPVLTRSCIVLHLLVESTQPNNGMHPTGISSDAICKGRMPAQVSPGG